MNVILFSGLLKIPPLSPSFEEIGPNTQKQEQSWLYIIFCYYLNTSKNYNKSFISCEKESKMYCKSLTSPSKASFAVLTHSKLIIKCFPVFCSISVSKSFTWSSSSVLPSPYPFPRNETENYKLIICQIHSMAKWQDVTKSPVKV